MLNTLNINLKTDIKTDRPTTLPIKLMSQDKNNNQFILRFTNGGEPVNLDNTYTVEVLTKFKNSGASRLTSAIVRQDYATWEFDTAYITQGETVYNYVYVRKSGNLIISADANCFVFSVDLSEIDKGAGKVAEVYDENYEKYLEEFKVNVDFEEIAQAEQARKEAELLREESYEQKVDTAIVEADVVEKVDNKVTELTPQINNLTAQLAQTETELVKNGQEINKKIGNGVLAEMGDLSQSVKEAMTGGSVAVVGEGAVTKVNLANDLRSEIEVPIKNAFSNSDFSEGLSDWSSYSDSILEAVENVVTITNSGSSRSHGVIGRVDEGSVGDTVFFKFEFMLSDVSYLEAIYVNVSRSNIQEIVIDTIVESNKWYEVYGTYEKTEIYKPYFSIYAAYDTPANATNKTMKLTRPLAVNLTETFGKHSEPASEDFLNMLDVFNGRWFNGTTNLWSAKNMSKYLFNNLSGLSSILSTLVEVN